jgi:hypothetical protein
MKKRDITEINWVEKIIYDFFALFFVVTTKWERDK